MSSRIVLDGSATNEGAILSRFGARYDSSSLGRFMTPDWAARPTAVPYAVFGDPQSLNLYGYVRNDPVSRADLDGHAAEADAFRNLGDQSPWAYGMLGMSTAAWNWLTGLSDMQHAQMLRIQAALKKAAAQNQSPAQNQVAMAAEKEALGLTRAALKEGHRVEYGGWIIKSNKDGSLSYTKPAKGGEGEIDIDKIPVPKGFSKVAEYHTHPHTTSAEGEGPSTGDINRLRIVAHDEHVDRTGYVSDAYSGNVYRYTQWEPIKSMYDTAVYGTKIGNIPPD